MTSNSNLHYHRDTATHQASSPQRLSQRIVPVRRIADLNHGSNVEGETSSPIDTLKKQLTDRTTELRLAQQRLQNNQFKIKELADAMSHDLRTPLRAIAGFSELLRQDYKGKLDETADKYLNHVENGAVRMEHLIQELVQYSRISSESLPNDIIDLNDLLARALATSENLTVDHDTIVINGDLPQIRGDLFQLTLLLQKLIENGLRFNDSEFPKIQIQVQRVGEDCHIIVCDNGIGIAKKHLQCAFNLFRRLNLRETFEGEGAGLAICRRIAERHSGKLWLESKEGVGTKAILRLPAV